MISFKELLTEAYSFSNAKKGENSVSYSFKNKQGDSIFVAISNGYYEDFWVDLVGKNAEPQDITEDGLILDIVFGNSKGDTWAMNNSGDGVAVLNTVGDIIRRFIEVDFKGYGKFELQCHPAQEEEEETSRDSKRDRVYQMFAEKMMRKLPYVKSVDSLGGDWGDEEYEIYIEIDKTV